MGRWNAGVRGAGREVLLSRTQGGMVSYTFAGNEFVLRRPAITTFRPLTDNDRGAGHGFERVQWLGAGRYARCVDNVLEQIDDSTLKGTYTYELATAQRTKVTVSYTAHTDGRVTCTSNTLESRVTCPPSPRSASNGRCLCSTRT